MGCALLIAVLVAAVSPALASESALRGPAESSLATHAARAQVAASPDPIWGGLTSQGWPVVVEIPKSEKRVRLGLVALRMSCTSGAVFAQMAGVGNLAIGAAGNVGRTRSISAQPGSGASLTGGSVSFAARLNRQGLTMSGTWHLHLDYLLSSGQTDHCDSGTVRFFVSR
jgi:hypothetical protein